MGCWLGCSSRRAAGFGLFLVLSAAPARAAVPVWDQSNVSTVNANNISGAVIAADFVLSNGALLTGATIWLQDGAAGDNGALDNFSGRLSWAVYPSSGGVPGTLSATGNAVNILQRDTVQAPGGDVVQVSFELSEPVALTSGTYFLALHENAWGEVSDPSSVYWSVTASIVGDDGKWSNNVANPSNWFDLLFDSAFTLYAGVSAWNQLGGSGTTGLDITTKATATEFFFEESTTFSTLDVLLFENGASDDGALGGFSGTLGWAIYDDDAGKPGSVIASGTETAPLLADTGRQSAANDSDIVRARIRLGQRTLGAGTYWLALHEGVWPSGSDGTAIFWSQAPNFIANGIRQDSNPAAPSAWATSSAVDVAFLLFEDQLFAAGFEAGTACAWSNVPAVGCP